MLDAFKKIGIELTDHQVRQFEIYQKEILIWNDRASLVSKNDESRIVERHFLESAALLNLGCFNAAVSVLDLGAGGGFPGMPIKILRPPIKLTLLDSRRIKTLFLQSLVQKLALDNTSVVCGRAENLKDDPNFVNQFEVVLARAVAELAKVYSWAKPFLKPQGVFVTIKGSKLEAELKVFRARFPSATVSILSFPALLEEHTPHQKIALVSE